MIGCLLLSFRPTTFILQSLLVTWKIVEKIMYFFCGTKCFGGIFFFHFPSQENRKETHGHNSKVKKTHEHKF